MNKNKHFNTSALYSRCDRILQGHERPKIPTYTNFRGSDKKIPSLQTVTPAETFKRQTNVYTGGNMIGIATMHKSNSVPVFSEDDAKDISRMRRG